MLTFPITGCIDRDQMLPDFRSNHSSTFWRTIYIVSMFVVFSYILFDVLDLDGSDFPRPRAPVERNVVVAEVPKDIKIAYCLDRTELWVEHSLLVPAICNETMSVLRTRESRFSHLDSARAHRYRVALPRFFSSDLFQFF